MSLSQIFAGIKDVMPSIVKYEVGATAVYGEDGPPRIVWVPTTETITSSRGHGGDSTPGMFPGAPSIATREVNCECHVWAVSMDAVEQLRDIVHNALQLLIWGSYEVKSARWLNNDGQLVKHGHAYVMEVVIQVPVTRPADFHLHVTSFNQTCQMNFLNGNVETV